jgi:hypothetical protein
MTRRHKIAMVIAAVLVLVYLSGPIIAGIYGIGDARGPRMYPRAIHEGFYSLAYEISFGTDCRVGRDKTMPPRPIFYDLDPQHWQINHVDR